MNKLWLLALLALAACSMQQSAIDQPIVGSSSFVFGNNLHCEILVSTQEDDIGKIITLMDLETDQPRVLFASGTDSPMKKVGEYEGSLTIQLATPAGSIDSITLDKETGIFARAVVGNMGSPYAGASRGTCK
jgi:hypothetical protein